MTPELYSSSWPTQAFMAVLEAGDVRVDERDALVDRLLDGSNPLITRKRHHGDTIEPRLEGLFEKGLVRRGIEGCIAEDLERDAIVRAASSAPVFIRSVNAFKTVQHVSDFDVAVVCRWSGVLRLRRKRACASKDGSDVRESFVIDAYQSPL